MGRMAERSNNADSSMINYRCIHESWRDRFWERRE